MIRLPAMLLVSCLALWHGTAAAQANAFGTAAVVNGVAITNADVERNFEEYRRENHIQIGAIRYPKRVNTMRQDVLNQLIDKEVLWQAAQDKGLVASDAEVDEALAQVRGQFSGETEFLTRLAMEGYDAESYREHVRKLVSAKKYMGFVTEGIEITDAEIHAFYVENPEKFKVPEAVRARHVLVGVRADASEETRLAARDKAEALLEELRGGAEFAAIAARDSDDSSASRGGDLGYFPRGKMVKPFEDAAFSLQAGQLSEIVESPFGLHIILVEDHLPAQIIPESVARDRIESHLRDERSEQRVADELAALRAAADIEIVAAL